MPAKTPTVIDPGTDGLFADLTAGLKHVRLLFADIDDTDTFTFDAAHEVTAVRCAWEPDTANEACGVSLDATGKVVTFDTDSTNYTGYLHLWITG